MSNPIEWQEAGGRATLYVERPLGMGAFRLEPAKAADLVAALDAMTLGDRETVLSASWNGIVMRGDYEHMVAERNEATARAEKAERECAKQRERADQKAAAHSDLAVAHRKALLDLDEARLELFAVQVERDAARASLDVVRHDLAGTRQELREERDKLAVRGVTADAFRAATDRAEAALRAERTACDRAEKAAAEIAEARASADRAWRAVSEARKEQLLAEGAQEKAERERDDLRTRLLAAETAAAQREEQTRDPLFRAHESAAAAREPREYPLAEGSPPPSIDPERLDLVRRALSGYVDPDQSPEQAARVAVEVADAALAIMRGIV